MRRSLFCFKTCSLPSSLSDGLVADGWELFSTNSLREGKRLLGKQGCSVGLIIIDHDFPGLLEELSEFLRDHHAIEWVAALGPQVSLAPGYIEWILRFLFDHHTLPLEPTFLLQSLGHAYGRAVLRKTLEGASPDDFQEATENIVGSGAAITTLIRLIKKVAVTSAPVLIGGESGSGKELAAYAVHKLSKRCQGPFIAVNCGAISPTLMQSELFGARRGAFTGALRDRKGLIEAAHTGTIFLDEIGDLPFDMQINLLRFLQEQTITPVGATASIQLDVRVIAASNIDLQQAVINRTFRHDLLYRLNVVPLVVPPLRERREDIPALARHYFNVYRSDRALQVRGFSSAALRAMLDYAWPGNVRELINRIRRALVLAEHRLIYPEDLGLLPTLSSAKTTLDHLRHQTDRTALVETLAQTSGNVTRAAGALRVSRMTLYRMIDRYNIELPSTKRRRIA